ncbi:MAG: type II toxin-antitoxin system RelE/ParE family toxin [Acidovorax sp.]|nr:type II toxin-antitoxin system RelE/ParE family toxin [Acidovorax sp.]
MMPYLISYIVAGVLLGIGSIIHRRSAPGKASRFFLIVGLWPIFALAAPEFFVDQPEANRIEFHDDEENFVNLFGAISESDLTALTVEERSRLDRVKLAGVSGSTFFADSANFSDVLAQFWEERVPPEAFRLLRSARSRLEHEFWVDSGIRFSLAEPDWYVGFSIEFVKSIARVDKNKRARLLEAIRRIAEAPITPHGDTLKPLTGDLSGLWRYRMGDDRLVYKPDSQSKKIVLVSFGARGGIYE